MLRIFLWEIGMFCWDFPIDTEGVIEDSTFYAAYQIALCVRWALEVQASHYAIATHWLVILAEVNTVTQDRRDLLFKLSLAEIVEFGIRDSIWGTFAWFRKHLINIGAEADFIKIFVLNSHKDKGGKKTASRTTRLPRLFIMIRLSKVRRICCYKTIFSYISFTFCHGFAVVPCNSGRNLWMYICLFHHTNQVRFLMSFIWISI